MSHGSKQITRVPPTPIDQKAAKQGSAVTTTIQQEFRGPLPPPEVLEMYEKSCPGCAERILKMTEIQAAHRQEIERIIVSANIKQETRGQIFGLTACFFVLAAACICAAFGQPIPAAVIGSGGIAGIIIAFRVGSKAIEKEKLKV